MLEVILDKIFLASYGNFAGGEIGSFLNYLEDAGFFAYLLPFLLIFAIINAILKRTKIFGEDSKGINAIISLVVGLMALQLPMVTLFFSEIFPRLGIGLAVILALLILVGMFMDPEDKGLMYTVMVIGVIVLIIILVQTADAVGWQSANWWVDNWKTVAGIVVFIALFALAALSGSEPKPSKSPLAEALRGR